MESTPPEITSRIIRDLDDPDRPEVLVTTIGDLVLVELQHRRAGAAESVLVHPEAARWLAAALVLEAARADAVAAASAMDCEGDAKGGMG